MATAKPITWRKEVVQWRSGSTLYLSIPFTWMLPEAKEIAGKHNGPVIAGGPAVKLVGIDWAETADACEFDVLSMHNPLATFTTRGCPNRCGFCAVPRIEGEFRELEAWKPAPIVCDNNILAASDRHIERVVDSLLPFEGVDFNQGLDAELFKPFHADQLARLKSPMIRFAFDHVNAESHVADAIALARRHGLRKFHVYVLVGFRDKPDDALYRLEKVREWGIRPNPMRFQPLDAIAKNEYVGKHWTAGMLNDVMRYYSRLRYLEHIPFDEYHRNGDMPLMQGGYFDGDVEDE